MKNILITGGSGLIGSALSLFLTQKGFVVSHLSSRSTNNPTYKTFYWDIKKQYIDPQAFENCDAVIHLAGANIGAQQWSMAYKKVIYDSRILGTRLLVEKTHELEAPVKKVVFGSAVGIYGNRGTEELTTNSSPGQGFLAQLGSDWETEMHQLKNTGTPYSIIRTGVVMSDEGGAKKQIMQGHKLGIAIIPGSGKQYVPFIGIDELCELFYKELKSVETRTINGVTKSLPYKSFIKELYLPSCPWLMVHIPSWIIKMKLKEMSCLVLDSQNVVP